MIYFEVCSLLKDVLAFNKHFQINKQEAWGNI